MALGNGSAVALRAGLRGPLRAQTVTYFHNDASGTPLVATDATGNVVWKESYRPYGERQTNAPASSGNPIGYAGKPFDAAIGLSYMGARYYDPVLGRRAAATASPKRPAAAQPRPCLCEPVCAGLKPACS